MKHWTLALVCLSLGTVVLAAEPAAQLPPAATDPMDFRRDIQPILARCLKCHNGEREKGGLRLDDGQRAMAGGNSGPAIVPGKSAASRLVQVVAKLDPETVMPPSGPGLSAADIGKLRAWIDQGAKWADDGSTATAVTTRKSDHWAFQPIQRPELPPVAGLSWVRNPIDRFVLARLEKEKVKPSAEADRHTLIRRLSLDLLGLPPEPAEVDAFIKDPRPDAYERLVDRLLESPHFGERWGRHWLDQARYADSDGFEKDTGRPHAWRYRHWVIDALNRDLPFDQFTIEQLAGDLLPGGSTEQRVATGFHRNTLTNNEGGVDKEQFRVEAVVDRVNTTAKVWLGVTLGCAQCHDHKYDPFTQREYYQLFAFFNSDNEVNLPAPLPGDEATYAQKKTAFEAKRGALQAHLDSHVKAAQPAWEKNLTPDEIKALPAAAQSGLKVAVEKRSPGDAKAILDVFTKADAEAQKRAKALADFDKTAPQPTMAQTLALGFPRKTTVLIRGDFLRPGAEVQAGTLAVLPPLPETEKRTRLDLARWLVSADNPLTPRVTVNWIWHRYFGRGIVPTLEDFGTQGERPSHPELLDWLASEFVREGWGMKAMHKLIVTSATYRQSSQARPELLSRDANNVWLARQNRLRLEAEIVRDVALASSGLLTRTVGGPSVRPPQPAGISELTYANSARWVESTGPDRYRRGMYIWFQRTSPFPMLMTFDTPDGNLSCVRRDRSNTPLQALTLLNDTVFVECAQGLGRRLVTDLPGAEPAERIRHAYRLCVAREPSAAETKVLLGLYDSLRKACEAKPAEAAQLVGKFAPAGVSVPEAAAWMALARAVLNLDEVVTRE